MSKNIYNSFFFVRVKKTRGTPTLWGMAEETMEYVCNAIQSGYKKLPKNSFREN